MPGISAKRSLCSTKRPPPTTASWSSRMWRCCVFFLQAEDGIRDLTVTGVQTCALPICRIRAIERAANHRRHEERDESVSRVRLRTGDEFRLEREFLGACAQRRPQAQDVAEDLRLLDRRADRKARTAQQAVLLLRARIPSDDVGDQQRQQYPLARSDRCG